MTASLFRRFCWRFLFLLLISTLLSSVHLVLGVVNTTGTISLENTHGSVSANIGGESSLSVTFTKSSGGSSSADGGGGGTLEGEDNPCLASPPSTSHLFDELLSGKTYTLKSYTNTFWIKNVSFRVAENVKKVTFTLSHILTISCETTPPLDTSLEALAYERIDYVGVSPEILRDVTITFAVPEENRSIDPSTVRLYRYHGGDWETLATTFLGKRGSLLFFTASAPGLSMFAVGIPAPVEPGTEDTVGSGEGASEGSVTGKEQGGAITGGVTSNPSSGVTKESGSAATSGTGAHHGFPWSSLLIVLLLGGVLGGYYAYDYHRRLAAVKSAATEHETLVGRPEIDEDALKDPVEQLQEYIDKELRQGHTREELQRYLEEHGWPHDVVLSVLDRFTPEYLAQRGMLPHDEYAKVYAFLQEKLEKGYSPEVIKQSMIVAGWNEGLINALLADLTGRNEKLIAYVRAQRTAGKSDEEIRQALLAAGWSSAAVERAFREAA